MVFTVELEFTSPSLLSRALEDVLLAQAPANHPVPPALLLLPLEETRTLKGACCPTDIRRHPPAKYPFRRACRRSAYLQMLRCVVHAEVIRGVQTGDMSPTARPLYAWTISFPIRYAPGGKLLQRTVSAGNLAGRRFTRNSPKCSSDEHDSPVAAVGANAAACRKSPGPRNDTRAGQDGPSFAFPPADALSRSTGVSVYAVCDDPMAGTCPLGANFAARRRIAKSCRNSGPTR